MKKISARNPVNSNLLPFNEQDTEKVSIVNLLDKQLDHKLTSSSDIFICEIVGDCMSPLVLNGSAVMCDRSRAPRNGDLVVIEVEGCPLLKRYIEKAGEKFYQYDWPFKTTVPLTGKSYTIYGVVILAINNVAKLAA